jgi:hypothetical protein
MYIDRIITNFYNLSIIKKIRKFLSGFVYYFS